MNNEAEQKADKLLKKQAETFRKAGDAMVEHVLGDYTKEMLLAGHELSKQGIREWLLKNIETCPSSLGRGTPELDAHRQLYEGTLRFLDSLN